MRLTLLLALSLGSAACVPSYATMPPIQFEDLPYQSLAGQAWPARVASLPKVAETHQMIEVPEIAFVELNPEGKQTIVFLHGLGSYLKFWRYQLDEFAKKGYRVIAIDMIGYGKSSKPASFPYTMEAMGDAVRELLQQLEVSKPVLIGHSMGGQVALSYSIRYPSEPVAVVLTAPAGFETFSSREKGWFTSVFSTTLVKSTSEAGVWGAVGRNNFYRWSDDYLWLIEERVRLSGAKAFDQYAYAQVRSVHGLLDTDFVRAHLEKITVPTLIVHGDQDRLIPNPFMHGGESVELMSAASARIPKSKLTTLTDCGHMLQIDCHDEYNREVEGWLTEVAKP
jgi:pimeloyl-ACP methyl ester carboxylesterase